MDTPEPDGQPSNLATITLADKDYFTETFNRLAQPISDYSFSMNYIWGGSFPVYWSRIRRHLCIFANGTGDLTMLVPPVPEPNAAETDLLDCLLECFQIMDRYNGLHATTACSRIEYVSDEMLERILAVTGDQLSLSTTPMGGDYIYETCRMIDLAGGDLKSKRHARNRFIREYPDHWTADMADCHLPDCRRLLDFWQQYSDEVHQDQVTCDTFQSTNHLRHKEQRACRRALETYRDLGLRHRC